jgi:hypothetical protein
MTMSNMKTVRLLRRGITVVWWLTWIVAAAFLVLLPVLQATTGRPATPIYDVAVWAEPLAAADRVAAPGWGEARLYGVETNLEFSQPPGWFRFASLLSWGALFAVALFFLYHLRRLAERVEAGAAFDPDNTRRLRLLGGALLGSELLGGMVLWWQSHMVVGVVESAAFEFGRVYEVDPGVLFAALVLFVLAEIFRRGTLLEEDQALTV